MTIARSIVADFDRDSPLSAKVLEAVPADRFDWKPADKSMTLGRLAGHIAESPSWLGGMMEDTLDMGQLGDWKPFEPTSPADLMEVFRKNAALVGELLRDRDDAFMNATWTMKQGDTVLMQQTRHEAVRAFMLHHAIHHRGQLTVYLRLLGVAVPPTFGPTADDTMGM